MKMSDTERETAIFRPYPFDKTTSFDELDEIQNRNDTPYLYLKSTVCNKNAINKSIFNFSFADINQILPEIGFQPEEREEIEILNKITEEPQNESEATKVVQEDVKSEKVTKRTKLLEGVCEALWKVFVDLHLNMDDLKLKSHELSIIRCIITKKFLKDEKSGVNQELYHFGGTDLVQMIHELYQKHDSKKRKEEKIKFVFKHTIKNLKKRFFTANHLPTCLENEEKFFVYYFELTHKAKSLPLETFFDPLNTSHSLNPKFKTLSKDYLCLLFESGQFAADFIEYMKSKFLKDYQHNIIKKFKKLFKKLRKRMRQSGPAMYDPVIVEFTDKFTSNKRCKLPWSKKEIEDAITCFESHLKNLQ